MCQGLQWEIGAGDVLAHRLDEGIRTSRSGALVVSPAALDLFTWLSYRCFTARGRERVPLFGEFGLVSQLGSADYARPRKFREKWRDGSNSSERSRPNVRPTSTRMESL